ncbi:MAG: hypothetical protein ACKO34_02980 [Vampirovibrionales bacterium]
MIPEINKFLRQRIDDPVTMESTLITLKDMMRDISF